MSCQSVGLSGGRAKGWNYEVNQLLRLVANEACIAILQTLSRTPTGTAHRFSNTVPGETAPPSTPCEAQPAGGRHADTSRGPTSERPACSPPTLAMPVRSWNDICCESRAMHCLAMETISALGLNPTQTARSWQGRAAVCRVRWEAAQMPHGGYSDRCSSPQHRLCASRAPRCQCGYGGHTVILQAAAVGRFQHQARGTPCHIHGAAETAAPCKHGSQRMRQPPQSRGSLGQMLSDLTAQTYQPASTAREPLDRQTERPGQSSPSRQAQRQLTRFWNMACGMATVEPARRSASTAATTRAGGHRGIGEKPAEVFPP